MTYRQRVTRAKNMHVTDLSSSSHPSTALAVAWHGRIGWACGWIDSPTQLGHRLCLMDIIATDATQTAALTSIAYPWPHISRSQLLLILWSSTACSHSSHASMAYPQTHLTSAMCPAILARLSHDFEPAAEAQ